MTAPTLSTRTLNRTLLARQHLLGRVDRPARDALVHLVGLQAQDTRSPYLALHARLAGFDPRELSGLLERKEAVRMVLMRGTIHLVTAEDAAGLRPVMQPVLDNELTRVRTWARGLDGVDTGPVVAYGRELVEARPRTMAELRAAFGERWPEHDAGALAYAIRNLLPTVQATPRGLWDRTGAVALTTLEAWTGRPMDPPADLGEVLLRYLRAFGPATVGDASAWSRLTGLRAAFDRLRPGLRTYRDERGRELLDTAEGTLEDGDRPAPARLLPDFDNALLSHQDRTRVIPAATWPGPLEPGRTATFLVDGFVAGTWRLDGRGRATSLVLAPHAAIARADRAAVEAEAAGVLALVAPAVDPGAIRWLEPAG